MLRGENFAAVQSRRIRRSPGGPNRNVYGPYLFKHSLASARKLKAVGWELRTTIDLARLLVSEGSHSQASKLLMQVLRKSQLEKHQSTFGRGAIYYGD